MQLIQVCVGSSCFLKGSYQVLDTFTKLLEEYCLTDSVQIVGAFCMEQCQHGVSVSIDGTYHSVPDIDSARALFFSQILANQPEANK